MCLMYLCISDVPHCMKNEEFELEPVAQFPAKGLT